MLRALPLPVPATLSLIALLAASVDGEERRSTARVIDQIRAHRSGIAHWWVGNAGWLVKAGDLLVGIDLDLESKDRQDDENIFWTKGYPDELRLALSADLQKRYRKLAQGEMLLVP